MSNTYQSLSETTFPDNIDKYKIYVDVNLDNVTYIEQIQSDIASHNFDGAKAILAAHPELNNVIVTASLFQRFEDQIIAIEKTWASSIYDKITHVIQYKGDYSNTATYQMFNVVNYNNKSYQCISIDDITGVLPTNAENWSLLTIQGISGTGMSFFSSWTSTQEYKVQDCVPYGNKLWVCITVNTNQEPDTSPDYWKQIIVVPRQIIWSKNQPEDQESGDVWNEINDTDNSYITHVCQGNNSYVIKYPKSNANFISTSDGSDVQTKLNSLQSSVSEDNKISTYVHTYDSATKIHNLQGTGSNIKFLSTADYHDGDTWTVNGQTVTASTQDNQVLSAGCLKSGCIISCFYSNLKLNFKSAGFKKLQYNFFVQPNEPDNKYGIWIKSPTQYSVRNILSKDSYLIGGEFDQNCIQTKFKPSEFNKRIQKIVNNKLYYDRTYFTNGATISQSDLYDIDLTTNTTERIDAIVNNQTQGLFIYNNIIYGYPYGNSIYNCETQTRNSSYLQKFSDNFSDHFRQNNQWTSGSGLCGVTSTDIYTYSMLQGSDTSYDTFVFYDYNVATATWTTLHTDTKVPFTEFPTTAHDYDSYYYNHKIYLFSNFFNSHRLMIYDIVNDTISYSFDIHNVENFNPYVSYCNDPDDPNTTYGFMWFKMIGIDQNIFILQYVNTNPSKPYTYTPYIYNTDTDTITSLPQVSTNYFISGIFYIPNYGIVCSYYDDPTQNKRYVFSSESLPQNTFALSKGIEHYTDLFNEEAVLKLLHDASLIDYTPLFDNLTYTHKNWSFSNVWWYSDHFEELPTYVGDGTQWNKIKN